MYPRDTSRREGKFVLSALFVCFCATDLFIYAMAPEGNQSVVGGGLLLCTLWSAGLFAGVWVGQNWARYTMVVLLALSLIGGLVVYLDDTVSGHHAFSSAVVPRLIVNAAALGLLIWFPGIRNLDRKRYL